MADVDVEVGLTNLIAVVRRELEAAELSRFQQEKPPLFQLKELELDLQFVVVRSESAKAGFDLKVLSAGGDIGSEDQRTQKISLRFEVSPEAVRAGVLGTRFSSKSAHADNAAEEVRPL